MTVTMTMTMQEKQGTMPLLKWCVEKRKFFNAKMSIIQKNYIPTANLFV